MTLTGDGAGSLVEAWAAAPATARRAGLERHPGPVQGGRRGGPGPAGHRAVHRARPGRARAARLAGGRGCTATSRARWAALGGGADWPDGEQWLALAAEDHLDEAEPARTVTADADGVVAVEMDLPMPGIAYLQLS